jgi:Protein of unknown function (DUF2934)
MRWLALLLPNLEEAIRERAYHLWIANGKPEGQADIYWLNAQREILTTSVESLGRNAPAAAPTDTGLVAIRVTGRNGTSALDPGCSLIPGLRSRLSKHILAGIMVLSAVGACPPHDGVG